MTGTNWSRVPTTIVEMGFLSNRSDDSLMATDYFRQEAAIGIANGLDAFLEATAETETVENSSATVEPDADIVSTAASVGDAETNEP